MTQAHYFVSISEPRALRKNLLQSAKLAVTMHKVHHELGVVRERKSALLSDLAETVADLEKGLDALSGKLPTHDASSMPENMRAELSKHPQKAKKPKKQPKKAAAPEKAPVVERSEMDVLEDKLAAIEKKLNKL